MQLKIKKREDIKDLLNISSQREDESIRESVRKIIADIRQRKDEALFYYTEKFDNFTANKKNIKVTEEEIFQGQTVEEDVKEALKVASKRIENFCKDQLQKSWFSTEEGMILGENITPVERAGIYAPGGKATYPSTVLMTAIPAIVAGVKEIALATPAYNGEISPYILFAASLCNITEIYKIGGAQAIAAFAYGTESVKKVDLIAGPGNVYVNYAKKEVFGDVGIDALAGPSEVLLIVDETTPAQYAARDIVAQLEHDEDAKAFIVSLDEKKLKEIEDIAQKFIQKEERRDILEKSCKNVLFIHTNEENLKSVINTIACEHVEIMTEEPFSIYPQIENAGAIFIGNWSPAVLGDYIAGPNHTLPTQTCARFLSPLSPQTFMKKSSVIYFTKQAFEEKAPFAVKIAEIEKLFAHKNALQERLDDIEKGTS